MYSQFREREKRSLRKYVARRQTDILEGVKGFYRDAGISLLGNSHAAVQFSVYEPIKKFWRKYIRRDQNSGSRSEREDKLETLATLAISGSAKIIASTVTYPLQVVKSRLQASELTHISGDGIMEGSERFWREQGCRDFHEKLTKESPHLHITIYDFIIVVIHTTLQIALIFASVAIPH